MFTVICLILTIIGGINWLVIGLAGFNFVNWLFAGNLYFIARIIYALVGLSSLWVTYYLVRNFSRITHSNRAD
ncbi:MAG: DUF378 domain-containing protein [Clostridia bacterium]|nr:DUF378 domain-containing protein [Clostridia bacterium]